jgi:hypothetical protein
MVSFAVQKFLVSCTPICQTFLLITELLECYSGSYYLCLYVPEIVLRMGRGLREEDERVS